MKKLIITEAQIDAIKFRKGDLDFSSEIHQIFDEVHQFLKELSSSKELFERLLKSGCVHKSQDFIRIRFNFERCVLLDSFSEPFILSFATAMGAKKHPTQKGFFYHNPITKDCNITLALKHFLTDDEMLSKLDDIFTQRKSTFSHEFAHMLDYLKSNGGFLSGYDSNLTGKDYNKQQAEINAILQTVKSEFYSEYKEAYDSHVKFWKENTDDIINGMIDIDGLKEGQPKEYYFKVYLTELWVHGNVCNINYHLNHILDQIISKTGGLEERQKKQLTGRIFVFLNNLNDQFGIDCRLKINHQ